MLELNISERFTNNINQFFNEIESQISSEINSLKSQVEIDKTNLRGLMIIIHKEYENDPQALVVDTDIQPDLLPLCYLPFFQYIAHQVTEDTHRWPKHPAYDKHDKLVASKTANYESRVEH